MNFLGLLAKHLNSAVFILLVLVAFAIFAAYVLGKIVAKFDRMQSDVQGNSDKHTDLEKLVINMNAKVDLIYQNTHPNAIIQSQSPAALTDIGKKISSRIDAPSIYSRYSAKIKAELSKREHDNAYDIQINSFDIAKNFLLALLTAEEINIVKKAAFDYGVLEEDILLIFGILLRDEYLQEEGIPHIEIDRHDPNTRKN